MQQDIRLKRVYDTPEAGDGYRILVDRLWPRSFRKDVAPSNELRKWFGHEPARFDEFARRHEAALQPPCGNARSKAP